MALVLKKYIGCIVHKLIITVKCKPQHLILAKYGDLNQTLNQICNFSEYEIQSYLFVYKSDRNGGVSHLLQLTQN